MAEQPGKREPGDEPRTDLPPKKEPYYEGYFGTDEEERVEREEEAPAAPRVDEGSEGTPP
jgi:hypothetical protein